MIFVIGMIKKLRKNKIGLMMYAIIVIMGIKNMPLLPVREKKIGPKLWVISKIVLCFNLSQ